MQITREMILEISQEALRIIKKIRISETRYMVELKLLKALATLRMKKIFVFSMQSLRDPTQPGNCNLTNPADACLHPKY